MTFHSSLVIPFLPPAATLYSRRTPPKRSSWLSLVERPANSDADADTNVDEEDVESGANRAFDAGDEAEQEDDAGIDQEGVDSRCLDDPGAAADDADDDDSGKGKENLLKLCINNVYTIQSI